MENFSQNSLSLCGEICTDIEYSHESHGSLFYSFKLKTQRLSGTYDTINILARDTLLDEERFSIGDFVSIQSELRSFNKKTDDGNRLIISAFAKEITRAVSGESQNDLCLSGTICKPPVFRKTPLGREICDIMLAINRRYGRSDYIPLVVWGRNARHAGTLSVGDVILITGRIQSREYTKVEDGCETTRTAFEVSVSSIEAV